ncbi:MAG: hypothetical protein NVSMB18_26990 [Acetobacteraceae bacterium]
MRLCLALLVSVLCASWAAQAHAQANAQAHTQASRVASPTALCRAAIAAAEKSSGVPDRLMQAIGIIESGRADERGATTAWPWTINVEGVGHVFDTKAEAIAAVNEHRARGARSIDVGCMQVNLLHHGEAFASLEEAFDPAANARYAAQFLLRLLAQTGSWPRAVAGYHSLTPDIGGEYSRKVLAVWARPGLGQPAEPPIMTASLSGSTAGSLAGSMAGASNVAAANPATPAYATSTAMQTGTNARILPLSAAPNGTTTGRGLEAYRAAPTRLAFSALPRRG